LYSNSKYTEEKIDNPIYQMIEGCFLPFLERF